MAERSAGWIVWLAGLTCACADPQEEARLHLLEFRQRDMDTIGLNEELAFFFSAPVDASSVTSDSVRIVGDDGAEARGERRVRGNTLTFLPALPLASDLSDGGFRPDTPYRVILGGFPRPDGIRSIEGTLLSSGLVLTFSTAGFGGTSPLFVDPLRGPFRLQPRGKPGHHAVELEDGLLVLEYGEAVDPSSVPGCRFQLLASTPGAAELETTVELIENRRDYAALQVSPAGPEGSNSGRLPGGTYYLTMPGPELRTLGGRRVEPGWQMIQLSVPSARVTIGLSGAWDLADELPQGCDGTARWDEERGALRLRFPAAAGHGGDGVAGAREVQGRRDLHATRVEIDAASTVDLSGLVGPVVLRSQTSFLVRGRVVRQGGGSKPGPLTGKKDPLASELEGMAQRERTRWDPLGPWIERLTAPQQPWSHEPWTVLVAGGDLWIPEGGSLEVDGNLVLVAGGQIRVEGRALARADLWRTGEGQNLAAHGRNTILPLFLDEPRVNPLRIPLAFGALTRPLHWTRSTRDSRTWLVGHEGQGHLSATLIEEPPRAGIGRPASGGTVRFLLRLEVEPIEGEPWEAPRLERLELEGLVLAPSPRPDRP